MRVCAPTANTHSRRRALPPHLLPKGQTPYLGAGAPRTIRGAPGQSGVSGPASSPDLFPGERGCAAASLQISLGLREGGRSEPGRRGRLAGGVHRWAQIREAFLANQWQRGAGRRRVCAGGSAPAAEAAAAGLGGAGGGGFGGGCPHPRLRGPRPPPRGCAAGGCRERCPCTLFRSPPAGALGTRRCRSSPPSLPFLHLLGHPCRPVCLLLTSHNLASSAHTYPKHTPQARCAGVTAPPPPHPHPNPSTPQQLRPEGPPRPHGAVTHPPALVQVNLLSPRQSLDRLLGLSGGLLVTPPNAVTLAALNPECFREPGHCGRARGLSWIYKNVFNTYLLRAYYVLGTDEGPGCRAYDTDQISALG